MIRLTDEQWERIRKHFPEEHIPDGRAGRKPIPTRHVLEAVLWILNTGAQAIRMTKLPGLSSEPKCNTPADLIIGTVDQYLRECCHVTLFAFVG